MPMHDALNRGQADAGALKRLRGVQALEHAEQLVHVFHLEADSVVSNEYHYAIRPLFPCIRFRFRPAGGVRVNFTALEIRLTSTSRSMERSPYQAGKRRIFHTILRPFGLLPDFGQRFLHQLLQADHASYASQRGRFWKRPKGRRSGCPSVLPIPGSSSHSAGSSH